LSAENLNPVKHTVAPEQQTTNSWPQFINTLLRFRGEIEDRIPRYFDSNCLLVESAAVANRAGEAAFSSIADLTGIALRVVPDKSLFNAIDRLFSLKVEKILPCLDDSVSESALALDIAGQSVPEAEDRRNFIGALIENYEHQQRAQAERTLRNWSRFTTKRLLLPDGETLNYLAGGQGKRTLVVLNAYGQGLDYWKNLLAELAESHRILLWIPRGNDFQTIGMVRASPQQQHVEDIHALLQYEGVESCCLLGWCTGPRLAIEYCSRYPHGVTSMVFIAPSFKGPPQFARLETSYESGLEPLLRTVEQNPHTATLLLDALQRVVLAQGMVPGNGEDYHTHKGPELGLFLSSVNSSLQELVLQPFSSEEAVLAYARQLRDFWSYDFLAASSGIRVPVLFAAGEYDRIASPRIAQAVAKCFSGATFLEFKGGSHYLHYEQWDALAYIIGEFSQGREFSLSAYPWIAELNGSAIPQNENGQLK
jgi:pimeloyl-ACP methyl ester carboxylesterase